ncbi:Druantia anti-phage system protein DruA [Nocardiopsis protaetiae]|uniref:Druantia anti-phage system protein DruA n=1 Tax=Nocardiopsis protaetiae TaxID=3382270 RepID=UPI00387ADB52
MRTDAQKIMITRKSKCIPLVLSSGASPKERKSFARLCALLEQAKFDVDKSLDHAFWITTAELGDLYNQPWLAAATHTVIDLVDQGWTVKTNKNEILLSPPDSHADRTTEKLRIRRQEHLRRDAQLRQPSVRRFVQSMERAHQHGNRLVSIFNLMRDGRELAEALVADPSGQKIIQPYVQIVDSSVRCELTGFNLHDIWRYFRHTWSNAYSTVPGRSMPILIRDAATEHHAVIGLAAISSPVVQIAERDKWMRWDTKQLIDSLESDPTESIAQWIARRIIKQRDEIYIMDLLRDGVLEPNDLKAPTQDVVARLKEDAERHRAKHHQGGPIRGVRNVESNTWVARAETDLFRSKRSALLAETLEIQSHLGVYFGARPSAASLRKAVADPKARTQIGRLVRRARGERVGTVVADLTVCGAVAPYNALAAGKLVGALAVSPAVLASYRAKYSRPSEIASAMAGRPIIREARLAFVGTTSLYGTGSSQYNRLFWPAETMGGSDDARMGFYKIGRSRSFGTSHFSDATVQALVRLSEQNGGLIRVNGVFGEGVSPRLRKVRLGLAALGWPADELLKHGRERILYGVPLVDNLRDYSLGIDEEPRYILDPEQRDSVDSIAQWWFERWARKRAAQERAQETMRQHRLVRPIRHGARVPLPSNEEISPIESACSAAQPSLRKNSKTSS